jgi:holliday junction DNA helicase RuvA
MIASVRGEVLVRRPDHVVIEAGGVGYRLAVSAETLKAVPARGKKATLHAQLVVRDDAMQLYGFASEEERDLFVSLTSVSQIGPKVAIAVLSGGTPRELLRAIAAGDAKRFQAVPGIGKRTAERIIVELREKVTGELEEGVSAASGDGAGEDEDDPRLLARDGLMHLGYTLTEADKLLDGVEGESPETLINSALRRAGQREAA